MGASSCVVPPVQIRNFHFLVVTDPSFSQAHNIARVFDDFKVRMHSRSFVATNSPSIESLAIVQLRLRAPIHVALGFVHWRS